MSISVIIPTYNRARLLPRAVGSIPRQAETEIIIIDDGSTDDTWQVIEQLRTADPRIRTLRFSHNRGVNAARNAGIAQASGEWVSMLDSDDEYIEGGFETLTRELSQVPEDVDVVGFMTLREIGGCMEPRGYRPGASWESIEPTYTDVLFKEGIRGDIHYCLRRSLFEEGYIFAEYVNGFESAFYAKLARDGKRFLYRNILVDRRHSDPGYHLSDEPYKRWPRQFARAYREFVRDHYQALRVHPSALRGYYRRIGSSLLRSGNPLGFWWILRSISLRVRFGHSV
jgi:glycosyltransferase involved in cell wall biosynthesis